jgi:hypothetical protein
MGECAADWRVTAAHRGGAQLNRGLEAQVAEQVEELGRIGRLKRFLAPQLAELIVSHGDEKILESHRRETAISSGSPENGRRDPSGEGMPVS